MAEPARKISFNWKGAGLSFDQRALRRLAIWGTAAAAALLVAALSAHFSAGSRPGMSTAAASTDAAFPVAPIVAHLAARSEDLENETRRLTEAVVTLTSDRDRLIMRLASLERSLEDITGSTKRQPAPLPSPTAASPTATSQTAAIPTAAASAAATPTAATPTAAPPTAASPATASPVAVAAPLPSSAMAALMAPVPLASRDQISPNIEAPPAPPAPAAADPAPARRSGNAASTTAPAPGEFAVDVGGATSFDGLRGLWSTTRAVEAGLFDGLQPLVIVRENKARGAELRLIVGPLANMDAATRLCVALSVERRYCQPTAFEGQELALNVPEREPERRPVSSSQRKSAPAPTNQRQSSRPKS
jgi:TolA-binding protein